MSLRHDLTDPAIMTPEDRLAAMAMVRPARPLSRRPRHNQHISELCKLFNHNILHLIIFQNPLAILSRRGRVST